MKIIQFIRNSKWFKLIIANKVVLMLVHIVGPSFFLSLTSGPTQPEAMSFTPISNSDMVNPFTGDFSYNIPLFTLPGPNGGYPFTLGYNAGPGMNQEATWVGLGWNLNAGALTRSMSGVPDEFNGEDKIRVKQDRKDNWSLGFKADLPEVQVFAANPLLGSISGISYNSYSGIGLNWGHVLFGFGSDDGPVSGGLTLDSEGGLGISTGVRTGMDKQVSKSMEFSLSGKGNLKTSIGIGSMGLGFSRVDNNHVLGIGTPMHTWAIDLSLSFGPSFGGVFASSDIAGNFSNTSVKNKGEWVDHSAFGYENMEASENRKNEIYDFQRAKSGTYHKDIPNMGYPIFSNDNYSSTAHGLMGGFRAWRNDIGRLHDPKSRSTTTGVSLSADIGANKIGLGFTFPFGWSVQGELNENKSGNSLEFRDQTYFNNTIGNSSAEKSYFKMFGEKTSKPTNEYNYQGDINRPFIPDDIPWVNNTDQTHDFDSPSYGNGIRTNSERVKRTTSINKISNRDIVNSHNDANGIDQLMAYVQSGNTDQRPETVLSQIDGIPEYEVFYYDWSDIQLGTLNPHEQDFANKDEKWKYLNKLPRGRNNENVWHHYSGFTNTTGDGTRYVYGLPAYNKKSIDNLFSVDPAASDPLTVGFGNTSGEVDYEQGEKFLRKKDMPPYAHSYMLTSILGADYVDLTNNGPTADDHGYWVKFDYVKYADNYKWRAPYQEANYSSGRKSVSWDDKATYAYGEKEMWYLGRAETATHVVIFHMSERRDNVEAYGEFAQSGEIGSQSGLKIDKISLYTREAYYNESNPRPVKEVHMKYTYELCKGVPNYNANIADQSVDDYINTLSGNSTTYLGGKLTLKEVYFTYQGNERGMTNPYRFRYNNYSIYGSEVLFNEHNVDKWGQFKDYQSSSIEAQHLPYTDQMEDRVIHDKKAGNWSVSRINLPSGGTIDVDYEADDYAYVQDLVANNMFYISALNDNTADNELYQNFIQAPGSVPDDFDELSGHKSRRVYFKLKDQTISNLTGQVAADYIYERYIQPIKKDAGGKRNLYFKIYSNLRGNVEDFVAGYHPLEPNGSYNNEYYYGIKEEAGIKYGYLTLARPEKKDDTYFDHHPFALAAWQGMKVNDPQLLNAPPLAFSDFSDDVANSLPNGQQVMEQLQNLGNFIAIVQQQLAGYRQYCKLHQFAKTIDLSKSVIKLGTPDRTKVGGGHRVKRITISDNWDDMTSQSGQNSSYGLEYDYSIEEKDPYITDEDQYKKITSGVATYEPLRGGDELATRYPVYHTNRMFLKSNDNLFSEHPFNEEYFPSPVVGYRKVTVTSTNTKDRIAGLNNIDDVVGGIAGVQVNEFYTAKEFPVIVKQTRIEKKAFNLSAPIPFVGSVSIQNFKGAQGYLVETNDMHGKPKFVGTYGFKDDLTLKENPEKAVQYNYQHTDLNVEKGTFKLDNNVKTLSPDMTVSDEIMGVESETFTDQNRNFSFNASPGFSLDIDLIFTFPNPIPAPVPTGSGSYSQNTKLFKSVVTNKVVHRSGIIESIENFNGDFVSKAENIYYDGETGGALLSRSTNSFDDQTYQLKIPAHWAYEGMGSAYKNIGLKFNAQIGNVDHFSMTLTPDIEASLYPGDELLASFKIAGYNVSRKVIYLGYYQGGSQFVFPNGDSPQSSTLATFEVIRSGRRNLLGAEVASYLVLDNDPTVDLNPVTQLQTNTANYSGSEYDGNTMISNSINNHPILSNVISASAVKYKDTWLGNSNNANNSYSSGEAGIWKQIRSYFNTTPRTASATSSNQAKIREDGVMNNVSYFNWEVENWGEYDNNWTYSSDATRYDANSNGIEVQNRLGVYTASLVDPSSNFALASGANARNGEFGVEDFERFEDGTSLMSATERSSGMLRLMGAPDDQQQFIQEYVLNFKQATILSSTFSALIEGDQNLMDKLNYSGVKIELRGEGSNHGENLIFTVGGLTATQLVGTNLIRVSCILPTALSGYFSGSLHLAHYNSDSYDVKRITGASVSSDKAHTGKKSLKFVGNPAIQYKLPQVDLNLIPGKKYHFSFWVNDEEYQKSQGIVSDSYDNFTYFLEDHNGLPANLNIENVYKSPIINGWQQVSMTFTYVSGSPLSGEDKPIFIGFQPSNGTDPLYIDDVRIQPAQGGIEAYVYDYENFRVAATLSDQNFATFYYYGAQGSLYLTKVETEEGIHTVTENRIFTKHND